jgi:hypothetical protein
MTTSAKSQIDGTVPVAARVAASEAPQSLRRRSRLGQTPPNNAFAKGTRADSLDRMQNGMVTTSTMVLTTDASGRPRWADVDWPACDERLVTVTDWPMPVETG